MVAATVRRLFAGTSAVALLLGWLELSPAFGFPVTDAAAMIDRALGSRREEDLAGWLLLLVAVGAVAAIYLLLIGPRAHATWTGPVYGVAAWLAVGAVAMPLLAAVQGTPPAGETSADPMRASFFMSNLGAGAAAGALVGWLLFGIALGLASTLRSSTGVLGGVVLAAVGAGVIAHQVPAWTEQLKDGATASSTVPNLPPGRIFVSILELPQPAGAVLGPHRHVQGFVVGLSGTSTLRYSGGSSQDVGPGQLAITAPLEPHSHLNSAAVPPAIGLAVLIVAFLTGWWLLRGRPAGAFPASAALIAAAVAAGNPFMNQWYFVALRPEAARGAPMPVPAGHRAYESAILAGIRDGPYREQVTERVLASGQSVPVLGPGAVVLKSGALTLQSGSNVSPVRPGWGVTLAGGNTLRAGSPDTQIVMIQLIPT